MSLYLSYHLFLPNPHIHYLLSFDKGRISIDYVIGYAGTREQATISINSAELDLTIESPLDKIPINTELT